MFFKAVQQIKVAFIFLILLTVLTGLIYPLIVTELAQFFFPWEANGSLIQSDKKLIGSLLIGQSFTSEKYFWGRPSATVPPYNAENSSASNLALTNPAYLTEIKKRVALNNKNNLHNKNNLIPIDLVTASGSGLDPEISPAAAYDQVPRIANARKISEDMLKKLILAFTKKRFLGLFGEPRVNVLQLNLILDNINYERTSA